MHETCHRHFDHWKNARTWGERGILGQCSCKYFGDAKSVGGQLPVGPGWKTHFQNMLKIGNASKNDKGPGGFRLRLQLSPTLSFPMTFV